MLANFIKPGLRLGDWEVAFTEGASYFFAWSLTQAIKTLFYLLFIVILSHFINQTL